MDKQLVAELIDTIKDLADDAETEFEQDKLVSLRSTVEEIERYAQEIQHELNYGGVL